MGQAVLGILAPGDVPQVGYIPVDVGVGGEVGNRGLEPQPLAVGTPEPDLLTDRCPGRPRLGHRVSQSRSVVRMEQRLSHQIVGLAARVAQDRLECRAGVLHYPVHSHHDHDVTGVVDQRREATF